MKAMIEITDLDKARERYKAFKRREQLSPQQKAKSSLSAEEKEIILDKLAQVFAELYRAEKKEEIKCQCRK